MIEVQFLIIIMVAHWVGDYVLQFNIIANNKPRSVRWLSLHVAIYAVVLLAAVSFQLSLPHAMKYVAVNGAAHFATDLVIGRMSRAFKDQPRLFYLVIGTDQMIHGITLILTYHLIIHRG